MIRAILHYFETGNGYQFWSGIGSDMSEAFPLIAILGGMYHHHNCAADGCKRIGRFHHPEHGNHVCKRHLVEQHKLHRDHAGDYNQP